jgi:outer membrane protein
MNPSFCGSSPRGSSSVGWWLRRAPRLCVAVCWATPIVLSAGLAASQQPPAAAPSSAPAPQGVLKLSVDDVLRLAVSSHPSLIAARAQAAAAVERSASARGRLLPVLSVHDEYQHWDSPFEIAFAGGPALVAREQDTNTFTAAVAQPLLGLLEGVQQHAARVSGAEARSLDAEAAEERLREELETQYLRLFEARALQQVAQASQAELAQQVSNTEVKVKTGTLTNADLLRVRVALSNARQQELVATTAETVARVSLLSAMGRSPDDTSVEFVEPARLLEQSQKPVVVAQLAPERRPEVRAAEQEVEAARHDERASFYALLPRVDLNAAYSRVDGQVFAAKNAAFVGIKADWPIWEWGASSSVHAAAEQAEVAARANAESARRQALVELSVRRAQLAAADSAVRLARESLGSAAEAYRVTEAVVRVGSGTTTDLLDAQAELTSARLSLTHSEYERAVVYVQLERAMGARAAP